MDNYNQMMNNDYNSMVYQNTTNQIPVEQQQQQHQLVGGDGSMLLPEDSVKIPTNDEYHEQRQSIVADLSQHHQQMESYPQDAHLQPQDVLLIQNHQAQLQQTSVIQQSEEYNSATEPMEQGNGDVVDEPSAGAEALNEMNDEEKAEAEPSNEEAPVTVKEGEVETAPDAETEGAQDEGVESEVKQEGQEAVEGTSEPPKPKEPKIDPEQCRACTSKENLQNIFEFKGEQVIANLIKLICPLLNISERDTLPHKICAACVEKVSLAYEFKQVAEQTDKDFRAHLKRSQNKRRTAQDYILLDAKVALLSSSEDDDDAMMQDDDEFKVSKSEVSEESEDSVDSDFKPKKKYYKKKTPSRKRKPPTSKSSSSKKKKGKPATPTTKGFKSNVVYIEAVDDDDSDAPTPKKKKRPTGVAAERPPGGLPCPQCDRVLANSHGLREHLKSHSTEKFTCKLCNKQFKLRLSLDAHMQRHREEKEKAESAAKAKVKIVKVPTPMVKKVTPSKPPSSSSSFKRDLSKRREGEPSTGKDLFKTCAPLTSTYWSDSYSD